LIEKPVHGTKSKKTRLKRPIPPKKIQLKSKEKQSERLLRKKRKLRLLLKARFLLIEWKFLQP